MPGHEPVFLLILLSAIVAACAPAPDDSRSSNGAGRESEIRIDVDNGTWINLDVSPDGEEIVFDLLGDLFVLPTEGGDAAPLVTGSAWENLPVYNPEGDEIAFTSDRSGTQNVWVIDRSTGASRQVTYESRHLPSGPAWAPDGRSIAVRRHFAARRTIGAGEIWTYPSAGGPGRALVERRSTQKDINEPRFSADGRFLYYSEDLWPGAAFEYNKDPSAGIYGIKRRDLVNGDARIVVQRPGGAVRPTPSPDGQSLAYVTRTGAQSALIVRDLASGNERVLLQDLDRDLQAVWANHGVYPAFDWLPDGDSIVLWSGGRIIRVNTADGRTAEIPFRVRQTLRVTEPPTPVFAVAKERFRVRALRWPTISPDGKSVVFQALGRIYLRDLAGGKTKPLHPDSNGLEFYPAFSSDGEWVVYSTWHDEAGGDVRRTSVSTGETVRLTDEPGIYLEPAISPDGATIVFRRAPGDLLVGAIEGARAGLYTIPWGGGIPTLVTENGSAPAFCGDTGRMFFVRRVPQKSLPPHDVEWLNHSRHLVSRDLDTGEEITHANAGLSTEMKLSRDCRWLAWVRQADIRVSPFDPDSVGTVELDAVEYLEAPGGGGAFPSWSDDNTLYWSLGPTLHSWHPADPHTPATTEAAGFGTDVAGRHGKLVLKGAQVVTMGAAGNLESATIVVEGDRILQVARPGEASIPQDAEVVDLSGKTILPGFIDSHWHGLYSAQGITPETNWSLVAGLAFGITTAFDPFADTHEVFAVSEMAQAGKTLSPRIYSTGTALYGAESEFTANIENVDDAMREIRRRTAFGAIAVKSYLLPKRSQQQHVISAAHSLGVRVVAEQAMTTPAIMAQVFDGHTSVEHNLPYEILYDDIVQAWSQTWVDHTPTLTVLLGGLWPSSYWLAQRDWYPRKSLLRHLPPQYLDLKRLQGGSGELSAHGFRQAAAEASKLHDAGVRIVAGAHAEVVGLGLHWELWMLREGGMSADEVIRSATIEAAEHLGLSADLGSIEAGKLADLVILDSNPLQDIRNTVSIRYVVIGGRLLNAETMLPVGE